MASYEINLYVVLATNPPLVRGANETHPSFDNTNVEVRSWDARDH